VAVKQQVEEPLVSPPQVALTSAIFRPGLLSGRTALITGGGNGLGRAIAREFEARCALSARTTRALSNDIEVDHAYWDVSGVLAVVLV
jgi:hypothetical protein